MRVHYLQHVPFEGLGSLGPWLAAAGREVSATRLFAGEPLPAVDQFDWLIVMGGPMGANDEAKFPWLSSEKQLIAEAISGGKRVLGICLGAQLIAAALGARVFPNEHREVGWFDVATEPTPPHRLKARLPPRFDAFHWHGDTFDLPAGAIRLASSAACRQQAFAIGDRILGLQFHLETTMASAIALIENCPDDMAPATFVQDSSAILNDAGRFDAANRLMVDALTAWLALTG